MDAQKNFIENIPKLEDIQMPFNMWVIKLYTSLPYLLLVNNKKTVDTTSMNLQEITLIAKAIFKSIHATQLHLCDIHEITIAMDNFWWSGVEDKEEWKMWTYKEHKGVVEWCSFCSVISP